MAAKFVCVIAALVAAALGEADPSYYGPAPYSYGYGFTAGRGYAPGYYKPYGKRSADPEPGYYGPTSYQSVSRVTPYGGVISYGVKTNGAYASVSEDRLSPLGYPVAKGYIGKRSAEAEPEPGYYGRPYGLPYGPRVPGIAAHPYGGSSYVYQSPQGLGKRSAEAEPEPLYYGYYPGSRSYQSVSRATPYGGASSYSVRSNGYAASVVENRVSPLGKRSAEAEPEAEPAYYGYGPVYGYGPARAYHPGRATSYTYRSIQGIRGKRSADPEPAYSSQYVSRVTPYGGISSYGVRTYGGAASTYENRLSPLGYAPYHY